MIQQYKNMANFGLTNDITFLNGTDIGGLLGGTYGLYKGATYNPDIIDPETGEKTKLNPLSRASLVLGGSSLGSMSGGLAGGLLTAPMAYRRAVRELENTDNIANSFM